MIIKKSEFLNAMKRCMPGIEKSASIIDGADTFIFSENAVHSYNDHISLSVSLSLPENMKGSVSGGDFFKLISKMPGNDIEIMIEPDSWKFKSGKIDAQIIIQQNEIFKYIETLKIKELNWVEIPSNFFEAMKLCKIGCNNTFHRGIFVKENKMFSTDITRINQFVLNSDMGLFWIDDPAVSELLKIPSINHYCVTETWVHFKSSDGVVFSCKRKQHEQYPFTQLEKIIEDHILAEGDIKNTLPVKIAEAVDRVGVMSSEIDGFDAIKMTLEKNNIILFSQRTSGNIKEVVDLETPFENDINLSIRVDPSFLIEAAKKVNNFYLKNFINNADSGHNIERKNLVFHNKNYVQITATWEGE